MAENKTEILEEDQVPNTELEIPEELQQEGDQEDFEETMSGETASEVNIEALFDEIDPDEDLSVEYDEIEGLEDAPDDISGKVVIGVTDELISRHNASLEDIFMYLQTPEGEQQIIKIAEENAVGNEFLPDTNREGNPEIKTFIQDNGIVITVLYTAKKDNRGGEGEPLEASFPGELEVEEEPDTEDKTLQD